MRSTSWLLLSALTLSTLSTLDAHARKASPFILTNTPEMMAHEKVAPQMEPWEDGLRQGTQPGNYEWWYFDANLDDGSKFVAAFFTKPNALSIGPLKPFVSLTLTRPDGTRIAESIHVKPSQFSASKSGCDVRIGNSHVSGDLDTYILKAAGKRLKADLTFRRIAPSWRPGAGKAYFDRGLKTYMGWVVPVPSGSVEGTISWPDGTLTAKGSGYHDHNWGNYPFYLVFDYWFWGRAHINDYTVLFFDAVGLKKWGRKHLPLFMTAKRDRIIMADPKHYTVTPGRLLADTVEHGRRIPEKLVIHAESDEARVDLTLSDARSMGRDDVLGAIPIEWLSNLLRPLFNPWYLRFESQADGRVTTSIATDELRGEGIYEIMLLGKAKPMEQIAE